MLNNKVMPRSVVSTLQPYTPGKAIWEVQQELGLDHVIKLASNENPLGASPKALKAVQGALSDVFRYPDASVLLLRKSIALVKMVFIAE